jgi:two-component system NtrC family response regulator
VIFLDVRLPDGNGLENLTTFREQPSTPEVIIMTGVGDPDGAELAVKGGAWDYIQKPFSKQEIVLLLHRALDYREKSAQKIPVILKREHIIGSSSRLQAHLDLLAQAANTDTNVLISGESGTGKELFARAIHQNSVRAGKKFVVVDCTALPENLVESVLFGHKKGAFTGADRTENGLFKYADGGTLFLDEVGELPLSIQKKFLRVLQEHRFRLVGSQQEISSDFRVVAATNRDLEQMVETGDFRQDLLYRLRAFTIELSPLRERFSDTRELTIHHISRICEVFEESSTCSHRSPGRGGLVPVLFWQSLSEFVRADVADRESVREEWSR